jgi:hypothetical protein
MKGTCSDGTSWKEETRYGMSHMGQARIDRSACAPAKLLDLRLKDFRHKPALLTRMDSKGPSVT